MRILFICTGNICRSPIAERLAMAYAGDYGLTGLQVSSAGTRALIGHGIHDHAAGVLKALGGSTRDFSARQLTASIATDADLIVSMTREHRDAVLRMAPRQLRKSFTFHEIDYLVRNHSARNLLDLAELRPQLSGRRLPEVADPIGQDTEVFHATGKTISQLLPPVLDLCSAST